MPWIQADHEAEEVIRRAHEACVEALRVRQQAKLARATSARLGGVPPRGQPKDRPAD